MIVSVKFLGYLRMELGRRDERLDLPAGASISMAMEELVKQLGASAEAALRSATGRGYNVLYSVNDQLAEPSTVLSDGDTIAIFSPSAGGGLISPGS